MVNRIIKQGLAEWEKCEWLQPEDLKKYTPIQWERLKESLKKNGFLSPLIVWEDKPGHLFILDSHHRHKAMRELMSIENIVIPKKLPAVYIDCKNKKEAKKAVLIYNSYYADIQPESLHEWIKDLNLEELNKEIDIKGLDLNFLEYEPKNKEKEISGDLETVIECPSCSYRW